MADPLSVTASLIAILQVSGALISACYDYRNGVKHARTRASGIIDEVRSLEQVLESLIDVLETEESLNGDKSSTRLPTVEVLAQADGPLRRAEIELAALKTKLSPSKTQWGAIKRELMWPLEEKEYLKAIDSLGQIKSILNLALTTDQTALTLSVHRGVEALQQSFDTFQSDETRQKIYNWLGAVDSSLDQHAARKKRQPSTGLWVVESANFREWVAIGSNCLWLHGSIGVGKTIICSAVVDEVQTHCKWNSERAFGFFFFDFNSCEKREYRTMICALIKQFSTQHPTCAEKLQDFYAKFSAQGKTPPTETLVDCLYDIIKPFDEVYFILDALDECKERESVYTFCSNLCNSGVPSHLLVSSRREKDIEDALLPLATGEISVEGRHVDDDIRIYVQERLKTDKRLKKWPRDVHAEIETTIVDGAHGMFRWATCQLDSIASCVRLGPLKAALKSLPKSLDETYERILLGISEDFYDDTFKILQWLCFSARPLRLSEICEVLAVDPKATPRFSIEQRLLDPRDVLSMCSSLVTISTPSKTESEAGVKLAHSSVKEYLISPRIATGRATIYAVSQMSANEALAEVCLSYLLHFDDHDLLSEETLPAFPLADYAARCWAYHTRIGQQGPPNSLLNKLSKDMLESNSQSFLTWLRLYDPDSPRKQRDFSQSLRDVASPIYYASLCGLTHTVEALLEDDTAAKQAVQGRRYTPLQAASSRGYTSVVQLLLDKSTVHEQEQCIALQVAALGAHLTVVRLLLDRGIDQNLQLGFYGNTLQAACSCRNANDLVVQLLLQSGADVNTYCGYYGNPLQAAAVQGRSIEVKALLNAGADVNAAGGCYGTALQAASGGGHEAVVCLLLDAGAAIDTQQSGKLPKAAGPVSEGTIEHNHDEFHASALQYASMGGHLAVVRILLERGADINAPGDYFGTALQAAAFSGSESIVGLLLDHNADINKQGGQASSQGATPLKAACSRGHTNIVRLLLERGADIDVSCGAYSNALQSAAFNGNETITKILLDKGANINASSGNDMNALDAAIRGNQVGNVKILLDAGADPNSNCRLGSALQVACKARSQPIVELLLSKGAMPTEQSNSHYVSSKGYDYAAHARDIIEESAANEVEEVLTHTAKRSALHDSWLKDDIPKLQHMLDAGAHQIPETLRWAAINNKAEFIPFLLDHGAPIHGVDAHQKTALHWAAEYGCEDALAILLHRAAQINLQDRYGETPLHYAAEGGHLSVARSLVEGGADWTIQDHSIRRGRTPLRCAQEGNHTTVVEYLSSLNLSPTSPI
ncbi:MAG: hypothetical protein M1833_005730 [Piccolia ochrophora]|nr:MAG: hypothetical protein M1833_005730 [Piccolia ochrophora]